MDQNGGTPLLARQNSSNYNVIFISLFIILLLLLVYLFIKWINAIHSSRQWLEIHRNLPTTKKNIAHVTKLAHLTKDEKNLLEIICHDFKVPNIEYLLRDEKAIDALFHNEYHALCEKSGSEKEKACLFTLRYKIEKVHNSTLIITSTKSIITGQEFIYTDIRGTLWTFVLYENNSQGLFLLLPAAFAASTFKPEQLTKLDLNFTAKSGIAYSTTVRVIRYEQAKDGNTLMLIGHTNIINPLQRRLSQRIPLNKNCKFSAVEVLGKGNDKEKKPEFKPVEKKYDGQIQDISTTGCQIICTLPIKEGQYIFIDFDIDDNTSTKEDVIGLILTTTQTVDTTRYVLHIQFVKIALEVRNRIYAFIYNYA